MKPTRSKVIRAQIFYRRQGYAIIAPHDLPPEWDFIARGTTGDIYVQVKTTPERVRLAETSAYPKYRHTHEVMVYSSDDDSKIVPDNRITYPTQSSC